MKKTWAVAVASAAMAISGIGVASAQNLCLPQGHGVPFDGGPPVWKDFNGGISPTAPIKATHDDPRWRGALALTYTTGSAAGAGSANPPIQFRSLWGTDNSMSSAPPAGYGTNRYMYLQWVVRIGVWGAPSGAQDLLIGFDRPNQGALVAGAKRGFMLRFHVGNPASVPIVDGKAISATLAQCTSGGPCTDTDDYFEVYERTAAPALSTDAGCTAHEESYRFEFNSTAIPWLERSLQYERRCISTDPNTCTKWIVSVRIPVITADATQVEAATRGVEDGSQVSYQLTVPLWDHDSNIGTPDLPGVVDHWPRLPAAALASPTSIYQDPSLTKVICKDADDNSGAGAGTGPAPWSTIPLWNGDDASRPALGCFGGWRLTSDRIGTIARPATDPAPSPSTVVGSSFDWAFRANISAGVRATNTVAAVPVNNGAACGHGAEPPCPRFKARFRLAEWGSQPAGSDATFSDIRGSGTGVCAEPPGGGSPTICGESGVTLTGHEPVVRFDWTVGGTGANFTEALEFCQYNITPPAGYPFTCLNNCDLGGTCVPATGQNCGVQAIPSPPGPGGSPCVRKLWTHQCMLVELDADNAADIEVQSTYKNMDVVPMSETKQEATISLGNLPPIPGQQVEEIFLVVMPRNMPSSLPAGTTGTSFVQQNARVTLEQLIRPYEEAAKGMDEDTIKEIEHGGWGGFGYGGSQLDPEIIEWPSQEVPQADLPRGARLMPPGLRQVAELYDGLSRYNTRAEQITNQTLDALDDISATALVPTLDIYVFRRVKNQMIQMTSFTMVVHHEGPLFGILWEIDGTTKLGPNLFKIEMPSGHKKRIQVRVMAKEKAGAKQEKGKDKWPCSKGGCCGGHTGYCSEPAGLASTVGTLLPAGLAGVILAGMGWRRRRKKAARKTE